MDIDLDGVVADFLAPTAKLVDQLVLADQATGAQQQDLQQCQLACRELDDLAVEAGNAFGLVVGQAADLDPGRVAGAAPGQCAHPGKELGQGEGLGQVIVGAGVEAAHAIFHAVLGGEDQHRGRHLAPAQALEYLDARQPGQAKVEQQQIVGLRKQRGVGIGAIIHMIDGIAGFAQGGDQALGNDAVVFCQKDSHDWTPLYPEPPVGRPAVRPWAGVRWHRSRTRRLSSCRPGPGSRRGISRRPCRVQRHPWPFRSSP